ncbi:hypothetical protein [Ralstonia phage RSP15]|uniref:antimicrobial peptide resistance and lipid A acylation protein PagP n=1 Tax=Ralstonia phage RSP15 TaxID=1785960 RepID=UPI00074D39D3|nr:antimicrobial peptide resistance and lipid A acylation protein PagP [Ralstonia phage RSP15]BAU40157.1 hypothetical protein [Ralstonia phage RSP15]
MKKLLIAVAASLAVLSVPAKAAEGDYSLMVYGASYHIHNGKHNTNMNEFNPGLGLEYEIKDNLFVGASGYKDSFSKFGYNAYVGYRYYPFDGPVFVSVRAGYLNGSGYHGFTALPSIGVTYKNLSLEFTTVPSRVYSGTVSMAWLRWSF